MWEGNTAGIKIVKNFPLETAVLEEMIGDPEDLGLVWSGAH